MLRHWIRGRWFFALVAATTLGGWAATARADSASEAAEAYSSGSKAYSRGDFCVAAKHFSRAYELAPHGSAAYSAGLAWQGCGNPARAADAYALAANESEIAPGERDDAKTRLADLEVKLAVLDIRSEEPVKISVAHLTDVATPLHVHVASGRHDLRAVFADGAEVHLEIDAVLGRTIPVSVARPAESPGASDEKRPTSTQPDEATSAGSTQRTLGWVALGGAGAAALTAAFLGTRALAARDEYFDSEFTDGDARKRAASLKTWTNVAWGGAAVLGAAGVTLLLTAPKREKAARSEPRVELRLMAGAASLQGVF